jgi:NAD(P)H-nitrite reductase large subunit
MTAQYATAQLPQFVIVGSGIAGLAAAEALRERQPKAVITMIAEEPHSFYSRPGLANLLRKDIPEKQLFIRNRDDLRQLDLKRIYARVEQLNCDRRELTLGGGQVVPYHRLLLATGALAVPPPFITQPLNGLAKLDNLDDARAILKQAKRGQSAVVVGGGITALELAEGLAACRMRVHYFLRGDRYWSDVLDETESRLVLDRLEHEGVTVHTNTQVKQIHGSHGQLTAVETQAGETIPCRLLAYAIGVRPRVDLAKSAGLKVDKGVLVNEYMHTSKPGVYAAGDVAQVGKAPLDVLWPTALAQGRTAGINMAGEKQAYVKGAPCNITMLTGLKVTIIGAVGGGGKAGGDPDLVAVVRGDSEGWRKSSSAWVAMESNDINRARLFLGERTIVGALVIGDQSWSRPLQRLIGAKADISPIRSQLLGDLKPALAALEAFYDQWDQASSCR